MKKHVLSFSLLVCLATIVSCCRKIQARRLEGTYTCAVDYHYWQMSNPQYTVDSTYTADLVIDFKKNVLTIDEFMIPIDSVRNEHKYHFGGYHYSADIQFINDSVYFYKSVLIGLGGGYTESFAGSKD
jgi:hypothetical protein